MMDEATAICPRCLGRGIDPDQHHHRYTGGGMDECAPCRTCGGTGESPE